MVCKRVMSRASVVRCAGFSGVVDGTDIGLPDVPLRLIEQGKVNKSPAGNPIQVLTQPPSLSVLTSASQPLCSYFILTLKWISTPVITVLTNPLLFLLHL